MSSARWSPVDPEKMFTRWMRAHTGAFMTSARPMKPRSVPQRIKCMYFRNHHKAIAKLPAMKAIMGPLEPVEAVIAAEESKPATASHLYFRPCHHREIK